VVWAEGNVPPPGLTRLQNHKSRLKFNKIALAEKVGEKGEEMQLLPMRTKEIGLSMILAWLILGCFFAGLTLPAPAQAQVGAGLMERPTPAPVAEEKKEEAPTTCGPLVSDTCVPLGPKKITLQMLWAYSLYPGTFTKNWRGETAGGNLGTFYMPFKITYGVMKNWETYLIIPFINNFANDVNAPGPTGNTSSSYAGVGDISWFNKYQFIEEGPNNPGVSGVFGVGFPSGHASNLNPGRLATDAIGTGAFAFTTGVNLYKWFKPLLVYSNIWLTSPVNLYPENGSNVRSREYVTFNVAAEYPLSKRFVALFEVYSNWTWTNLPGPQGYQTPQTVLGILPGIEFLATDKLSFAAGATLDMIGKNGVRKYTPLLTAYYSF
jgi:hypothetical protein